MYFGTATQLDLSSREDILRYLTLTHHRWYSMGTVPGEREGQLVGQIYCCYGRSDKIPRFKYEQNQLISKTLRPKGVFENWFGDILEEFAKTNPSGYWIEMGTGLGDSWDLFCFRENCNLQRLSEFKIDDLSGWSLESLCREAQTVIMFDNTYMKMRERLAEKLLHLMVA